jgi:hypothetical protein
MATDFDKILIGNHSSLMMETQKVSETLDYFRIEAVFRPTKFYFYKILVDCNRTAFW